MQGAGGWLSRSRQADSNPEVPLLPATPSSSEFVLGDDVTGHDNRKNAENLKVTITQEKIRIDPKFVPSFWVRDVLNYLFTSNRPDAFFLDDNDRRNFVWEVSCPPMTPEEVREYFEWLDGPGKSALFGHLLRLDLGGMDPAKLIDDAAAASVATNKGKANYHVSDFAKGVIERETRLGALGQLLEKMTECAEIISAEDESLRRPLAAFGALGA